MDLSCIGGWGPAECAARARCALLVCALLSVTDEGRAVAATITEIIDDPEVRACVERALPEKSMAQTVVIRVLDRVGTVSESRAKLYWKRFDDGHSRALIRFTAPPHRAGVALLLIESDKREPTMYLYLPELRQTRRITGKAFAGSMFGTDFSYEDFSHFQGIGTANDMRRVEDREVDGRPAYVLETVPLQPGSAYARIFTYIDQEQCLPLKTEFFARDGSLHKQLLIDRDQILEVGNRLIPQRITMYDYKEDSRTEIVVHKVEVDLQLPDLFFTDTELERER